MYILYQYWEQCLNADLFEFETRLVLKLYTESTRRTTQQKDD